jgi:Family of unknown function (DUF5670)
MLWTISVILSVFWLLGILESFTVGGYIHILLGMSLAVVVIQFIRNRNDLVRAKHQQYKGAIQLQGRQENQPRHSRDLTN